MVDPISYGIAEIEAESAGCRARGEPAIHLERLNLEGIEAKLRGIVIDDEELFDPEKQKEWFKRHCEHFPTHRAKTA